MSLPDISDRIRQLVGDLNITVENSGKASGSSTAYLDNVANGLEHYNAYGNVCSALPAIIEGGLSTPEKVEAIKGLLYSNAKDVVAAVRNYDTEFQTAVGLALGQASQVVIKDNPELNKTELKLEAGVQPKDRTHFTGTYTHRYMQNVPNPQTKETTTEERFGKVNVTHKVVAGKSASEQYKAMLVEVARNANAGLAD